VYRSRLRGTSPTIARAAALVSGFAESTRPFAAAIANLRSKHQDDASAVISCMSVLR